MLHATTVAARQGGRWVGVLIQGASGSGKSTLAARLVQRGWRLVADDRTVVWRSGGRLFGRAPPVLAGLIEARGLGVLSVTALPLVELRLALACSARAAELERVPEPAWLDLAGSRLPLWPVAAHDPGAEAAVGLLVAAQAPRLGL